MDIRRISIGTLVWQRPEGHAAQIIVGNSTIPKLLQFEFDDKALRHVDTIVSFESRIGRVSMQ